MLRKSELFSPPRSPTEREKRIIQETMLKEIKAIQETLQKGEIDAEYIRESDRRYCTQVATRDPRLPKEGEWEKITTLEKKKATEDKTKAEKILGETFIVFEPVKVRKVRVTIEEEIFYIIKVIIHHFHPIICIPYERSGCNGKPVGIALRSLSMKDPFPWDEEEKSMPGGWYPSRPADRDIQKMIDKFKTKAEKERNTVFETFKAVTYQTQVVDGVNYSVKIPTDEGFLWMVLYEPPYSEVQFVGVYTHDQN